MHYAFDLWMTRTHPDLPWCRYADDGLVHCRSEQEAQALKAELQARLTECRLKNPTRRRPRLSTGRTESAEASIRTSSLTFSATAFGLGWSKNPRQTHCSADSPRSQRLGDEGHADDDPGTWASPSNRVVVGRHCSTDQSAPAGGGSHTTGDTRHRRSIPCFDTSI